MLESGLLRKQKEEIQRKRQGTKSQCEVKTRLSSVQGVKNKGVKG